MSAIGDTETQIATEEKKFIYTTKDSICRPFHSFLENDAKTIFREKRLLETKRLDLDAAKAKLKKVKTLEMRDQVEQEVRTLQVKNMATVCPGTIYWTSVRNVYIKIHHSHYIYINKKNLRRILKDNKNSSNYS